MLPELISHSPDLRQLVDEGYEVAIRAGHLVVYRVPYVNSDRRVRYGDLVTPISLDGDSVGRPLDHTAYFRGEYPCDESGNSIEGIRNSSNRCELACGLWVDHYFSAKPHGIEYTGFHHKMTTYADILGRYARRIDPGATARTGSLTLVDDPNDPFVYMETSSSRSGITRVSETLANDRVGIVGLGGTGSYILDYVSKTRVAEIHLFDGDRFLQHNAFRAPGATTKEDISERPNKAELYAARYSVMRRGVIACGSHIRERDLPRLRQLDFVFVSVDDNVVRRWLLPGLLQQGVPFIDVGMGIERAGDKLLGIVRTTLGTAASGVYGPQLKKLQRDPSPYGRAEYEQNVQIVELNALNAALAVIRWKKWRGFYLDLEHELQSTYTLDGNVLANTGTLQPHEYDELTS